MILLLTRDLREAGEVLRLKRILDKGFIWSPPAGGEAPAVGEAQASPSLYQEQTIYTKLEEELFQAA